MALALQDSLAQAGADLESQNEKVVCGALAIIHYAGVSGESYFSKVLDIAKSSSSLAVKRSAVEALAVTCTGKAGEATPVLEDGLASSDAGIRRASAQGLGTLKAEGSISKISPLLTDSHMLVRNAAMEALGAVGAKAGSEANVVASNIRAPLLREGAIRALGKMGKEGAAHVDDIAIYLEDSDSRIRVAVCEALRDMGDLVPDSIVAKAADLLDHQLDRYRATAALAVGSCGAKGMQHKAKLLKMLRENAANFKEPLLQPNCAAAVALGRLGVEGEQLIAYLKSKSPRMRMAVCQAIAEMGKAGLGHAAAVAGCLEDEEFAVRSSALAALESLKKAGNLDSAATAAMDSFKKGN